MRQYGFYVVWGLLVIGLILVSIYFQPTSGAMVAEVRSEITTVSFEKPIRVEKIHVVPGQEIKKGDLLVETVQSKMKLDLHQKQNDIEAVNLELQANESEFSGRVRLLKLETEGKIARLQS